MFQNEAPVQVAEVCNYTVYDRKKFPRQSLLNICNGRIWPHLMEVALLSLQTAKLNRGGCGCGTEWYASSVGTVLTLHVLFQLLLVSSFLLFFSPSNCWACLKRSWKIVFFCLCLLILSTHCTALWICLMFSHNSLRPAFLLDGVFLKICQSWCLNLNNHLISYCLFFFLSCGLSPGNKTNLCKFPSALFLMKGRNEV